MFFFFLTAQPERKFQQRLPSDGQFIVREISSVASKNDQFRGSIKSTFQHGLDLDQVWKPWKDHQNDLKSQYETIEYDPTSSGRPSEDQYVQVMENMFDSAVRGLESFAMKADRIGLMLTPRNGQGNVYGWQKLHSPVTDRQTCERILARLKSLGSGREIYRRHLDGSKQTKVTYRRKVARYMHMICILAVILLLNDENYFDSSRRCGGRYGVIGLWLVTDKPVLKDALDLFPHFAASRGYFGMVPLVGLLDVPSGADRQVDMLMAELQKSLRAMHDLTNQNT